VNNIQAWLERLTAASGEFNRAKVGKLAFLGNVFLDVRPEIARNGQTIRIPFPDTGAWTDMAGNDWVPAPTSPLYVDVPFGQRPGNALLFADFEQMQTATDLIDQFLDPMFKRGLEYANGQIAGLITAANFPTYPALQSTKLGSIDIDTAANAWNVLVANKVPIQDPDQAALIVHPDVHRNMLTDSQWYQESLVGAMIAQGTRTRAAEESPGRTSFNFNRFWDQQVTTSLTANLTGTVAINNGSTAVTGTSTTFTTQATVGTWITVDGGATYYRVGAVASDTALTLTQNFAAANVSGVTYQRRTYSCVVFHRYAIALAVRPLEIVNDGHIHSRLLMLQGLPFRVVVSWNHVQSGWMLTMDYAMVAKPIRPDFGVVVQA
jgi:hypothetical protein